MKDEMMAKIMDEVMKKMGGTQAENMFANDTVAAAPSPQGINEDLCGLTEYVGTAMGHTIGLVIANLDYSVHEMLKIDPKYRSIGIIADRVGAGPQIFAADEAVKATNTEAVIIECPRDTEGGAGHGCLIVFGAEDVSDARRAVEVGLSFVEKQFGDVYGNSAGHLEFQYTARASYCLEKAFGAVVGKAFGITVGAPSGIGIVLADTACKTATIDPIAIATPGNGGTSFSNEVNFFFSGDSGAVRQAIIGAREVGKQLLKALAPDEPLESSTVPYI